MKLFEGRIDRGCFCIEGDIGLPLPADAGISEARTYGIRPEDLDLAETGIPAGVLTVEPTGAETHLSVQVATQMAVIVLQAGRPVARAADPSCAQSRKNPPLLYSDSADFIIA
jgi:ABC-type sugar transport system ATPase subunit